MVKRQRFTAEFKREAVRLLDAGERPQKRGPQKRGQVHLQSFELAHGEGELACCVAARCLDGLRWGRSEPGPAHSVPFVLEELVEQVRKPCPALLDQMAVAA